MLSSCGHTARPSKILWVPGKLGKAGCVPGKVLGKSGIIGDVVLRNKKYMIFSGNIKHPGF